MNQAQNPHERRKAMTQKRNQKIRQRFTRLYEKDRLRMDDVVLRLCDEFCLSPITIERILNQ